MNINVQSVHFKASDQLKNHIEEKVRKLSDHSDKILRAEVILFEDGGSPANQICEIKLAVPGNQHIVKKGAATYEQAVSDAVATLKKVLRERKK